MANGRQPNYRAVTLRRKTFYRCGCPPRPKTNNTRDMVEWFNHHIQNCKPRSIQDVHLPPYEGDE